MFGQIAKWVGYFLFASIAAMVGGSIGIAIIGPHTELATITMFIVGLSLVIMLFEEAYLIRVVAAVAFAICFVGFVMSVMARIFI